MGRTNRLLEIERIFHRVATHIKEHNAISIFTGDLTDGRMYDPILLSSLFKSLNLIRDTGLPAYFIAGNHDFESKDRTLSNFNFLREVYKKTNLHFITEPILIFNDNLMLAFVPYHYDYNIIIKDIRDMVEKVVDQFEIEKNYKAMLVLHGDMYKAKWENRIATKGIKLHKIDNINIFDYIVAGHVHVKQNIKFLKRHKNIKQAYYTGSLMQKNMNEERLIKGFQILDVHGDKKSLVITNPDFTEFFIVKNENDLKDALELTDKCLVEIRMDVEKFGKEIKELKSKHDVRIRKVSKKISFGEDIYEMNTLTSWESVMEEVLEDTPELLDKHNQIMEEVK